MNLKVLIVVAFVVGCACAVPLESKPDNSTLLVSDSLEPAEDNSKKPSRSAESTSVNGTATTAAPLLAHNETLPVSEHHEKHPSVRDAPQEKMIMSTKSNVTEGKNDTHHLGMVDLKKSTNTTEAPIKKRAIAGTNKDKKIEADVKKSSKDSPKEKETEKVVSTDKQLADESKINATIPIQNDTAVMEAILKHGLLDEKSGSENATKPTLSNNSTTVEVNKTVHAEHKEHTRHTESDCDDASHPDLDVLAERSIKQENNSTVSKNETVTAKPTEKVRRRRGAYGSSSQVRLAVRNTPVARSSYEAPAAAPARSSYEAPAAAPARSSYEAPADTPAPSSYEAPAARSSYEAPAVRSSYEAPAVRSSYEAPADTPAPTSYEAPAPPPARSSYKAPATRSSYSRAAPIRSSYEAPAATPARSSYEAPADTPAPSSYEAPAARSTYEAPADTPAPTSYEAPAVRTSYEAPAVRTSYEAPAVRTSYKAPSVRTSYKAPAAPPAPPSYAPAVRTAVRSSYPAPAARSSSY